MTADDLVSRLRSAATFARANGLAGELIDNAEEAADAIEARDAEIAALRQVLRALDVSVDDGEIAAFEPIERPSPAQLDAVLRALADTERDPQRGDSA